MRIKLLKIIGSWRSIADAANTTIHREEGVNEPSSLWKKRMLLSEHSPIRKLHVGAKWYGLKYWVSVHFVRHELGIEHFVRTERSDRTGVNRDEIPQGATVEHEFEANAQAIINISRKRLCTNASPETREAWKAFVESIVDKEPELYAACVPDCIYRGYCYDFRTCGYYKTSAYKQRLLEYRKGIRDDKS